MLGGTKYHALRVDDTKCFGCTHCMQVCPTEAIRIRSGLAEVNNRRCVDCGNCMRACPANAIYILQDDLRQIDHFRYRVALFPSVMIGQFPEEISDNQIYGALLQLGFTHAFEVEQPIAWLMDEMKRYESDQAVRRPVISSFCPAIVRLIQIKYPDLVGNIMPLKAPHELAANYVREELIAQGAQSAEIGIFYIAPCSAKIAAVRDPMVGDGGIISGVINMDSLYNRVMSLLAQNPKVATLSFREGISREGILWPLTRGEARLFKRRSMAVDGIHNVTTILEKVESEQLSDIDFLELRSCDQSCAGGILVSGNRFLTAERLKRRVQRYPRASEVFSNSLHKEKIKPQLRIGKIEQSDAFQLHGDRDKALERMTRMEQIICQLPGIDCGGCGAPNCHALAEDIVTGQARMTDCVHLLQRWQSEGKITASRAFSRLERIWGNGRFVADCNKRGARNEGF